MRKHSLFILLLLPCLLWLKQPRIALAQTPRGNVSNGIAIYQERCAQCHGVFGMGDGELASQAVNPPTAVGNPNYATNATPSLMYDVITNGRPMRGMPPYGDSSSNPLSEQERWDVIGAIFALGTNSADFQGIPSPSIASDWKTTPQKTVETENNLPPTTAQAWRMAGFDYWLGRGILNGKVIDGSSAEPVAQTVVTVRHYEEGRVAQIYTTTTGNDGSYQFVFDNVAADWITRPQLTEGKYNFTGNFVRFTSNEMTQSADIVRYDSTEDLSSLRFDQLRTVVSITPNGLSINQLYQWTNIAQKLFVAPLTLFVPDGAANLTIHSIDANGQRRTVQTDSNGSQWMIASQLLPQTESQILVQYQLPYEGEQTIEHPFNTPPIQSTVFAPEGLQITGWDEVERNSTTGETFISYRRNGESSWTLTVSGYPKFSVDPTTGNRQLIRNTKQELIIGAITLLTGMIASTLLIFRWQNNNRPNPSSTLLLKIAELDDALALGTISAEQHTIERAQLFSQLK